MNTENSPTDSKAGTTPTTAAMNNSNVENIHVRFEINVNYQEKRYVDRKI